MAGQGQHVMSLETLAAGLRSEFFKTYLATGRGMDPKMSMVMDMGIQARARTEEYGYYEATPYPERWQQGESIPSESFNSQKFSVTILDWAKEITWHKNDREDDKTESLFEVARKLGRNFATLPERIFFQLLQGTSDPKLLPSVPNAPDGAAFFSTTDGSGAARFGATDGNSLTGSGVASSQAVRSDVQSGLSQFRLFQDTKGEPLWDDSTLESELLIIYGAANEEVFREAFLQARTADGSNNVSNVILDAGLRYRLWSSPRISNNDWYIFLSGAPEKATMRSIKRDIEEHIQNAQVSDITRKTKEEGISFDARHGYAIKLPYQAIRIDNV